MRRSILDAFDDHPADDDERPPSSWAVAVIDDCDGCGMGELRVVLTLEEVGRAGDRGGCAPCPRRRPDASGRRSVRRFAKIGEDPGKWDREACTWDPTPSGCSKAERAALCDTLERLGPDAADPV